MSAAEEIVTLQDDVFGILSQPQPAADSDLCIILLNAGFIHRSGPFRLHVRLARALAASGVAAFRYDAPGVGDALTRSSETQLQATRASLDALSAQFGYRRFVVGGICSAADLGWLLALADPRVVGLISIDGLARQGFWYSFGRMRRGLQKSPREWLTAIRLRLARSGASAAATASPEDLRDWPVRGSEREQLHRLVERKLEWFVLFTAGTSYFLHARQWLATFGREARSTLVEFRFWPRCDHTFFAESDRRKLIDAIVAWVGARFRH
ncbi:MAG TPA: alpha/beta fold hydrolase [Dokdonella sp.]|uniref:alpha/beta fold hydrolase n=1 Tax=Dokdonella sp. TaxID=2291710 RepID=UPI002D7EC967|nr:alpha/beta fold hydrolase [Dokdonella sp.]HET9032646.1 alpha/beta fold hydrolase [Dokdonella sp.]